MKGSCSLILEHKLEHKVLLHSLKLFRNLTILNYISSSSE